MTSSGNQNQPSAPLNFLPPPKDLPTPKTELRWWHRLRLWLSASKPADWLTAIAATAGVITVFASGVFDANRDATNAANERLNYEKLKLTDETKEMQKISISKLRT